MTGFDDLGDAIDSFSESFDVARADVGTYDANGRHVPALPSAFTARGSITPASAEDLKRLPEGRRTESVIRILTKTALRVEPQADVVSWNAQTWEVSSVAYWVGAFRDVLAVLRK